MRSISFHFTLKDQTIEEVREAYNAFVTANPELSLSLGGYSEEEVNQRLDAYHVAHHCFLPKALLEKKKLPLDVPFFFESIEGTPSLCYYGTTGRGIEADREAMVRGIKLSNGACVFLGKIDGGVQKEIALAEKWGCEIYKY